jgi:DDE superfamily endonuclease
VTPRLYRTTRPLAARLSVLLRRIDISAVGSPTMAALITLYVAGLILLDGRQTQTRVALFLPGRAHDALNRLLRMMPLSTRALMGLLVVFCKEHHKDGYLCIDDVVVEKAFARKLSWAGWTYSFAKKRKVYGVHIVVLLWCTSDGRWRIPVAFRLWRPKRSCASRAYRTKLRLAQAMLKEVLGSGLRPEYIVFDTHYSAGWFTKVVGRLGLVWVGTLHPRTIVLWRGRRRSVAELARRVPLKWRKRLAMRATAVVVYAPKYGTLRLVVTRNRHGNYEYIVTNDSGADPYEGGGAQDEPLAGRDAFPRHQAVRGIGGVPMPGRSSDGSPRRPRSAHLRGIADDAPIHAGECGLGKGALAVGGAARRRISSSTPQGLSTSSTCHRVSPVK